MALWKKHSIGDKMDVYQLMTALRDAAEEHHEWPLRRALDAGSAESLALAMLDRFATNGQDYLLQDEFSRLLEAVRLPLIPKERTFEEGFEYGRRRFQRLASVVVEPPSLEEDTSPPSKIVSPLATRRALGVFHPANLLCGAMLLPPGFPEILAWPFTAVCMGYPASYYCARPCYLRRASLARKMVLRRSTVELVNEGHPGYACCAGPLAVFLPLLLCCPADLWRHQRCVCEPGLLALGNQGPFLLSGSPHFFSTNCSDPIPPNKIVVPLQFVNEAIVVDHPCCSCCCCCSTSNQRCQSVYQAELSGTSTLAIVSPDDTVLAALDAVPRDQAVAFSESLIVAKRTARPLHPEAIQAYSRYLERSWVGLSAAARLASLPLAESHEIDEEESFVVHTAQPDHQEPQSCVEI